MVISTEIGLLIVLVSRHPWWKSNVTTQFLIALKLHFKLQKQRAQRDIMFNLQALLSISFTFHPFEKKKKNLNISAGMAATQSHMIEILLNKSHSYQQQQQPFIASGV